MARIVDQNLLSQRRAASMDVALACNLTDSLRDKCSDLLSMATRELEGHTGSMGLVGNLSRSRESLDQALSLLRRSADALRSVDATKEVPDQR